MIQYEYFAEWWLQCMHSGHRQRIRERIEKYGIDSLSDHEFIEYLLYYVQPRVNTNEPAHRLMNTYGSISKVLESDAASLMETEGIGPKSAQFLSLIPEICRRYYLDKYSPKDVFSSLDALLEYLQKLFLGITEEAAAIVLLDGSRGLISSKFIAQGNIREVYINRQDILIEVIQKKAPYVVLAHNHPSNQPQPSSEDFVLTNHLAAALNVAGITLMDHVILCPNGSYYSFSKEDRL